MSDQPGSARPRRRILVTALVITATIVGFFAITAVWANRQLLNTANWTESGSELLERDAVRQQVAAFLTDQAYSSLDVEAQIRSALPPRAAPLAAPAAGGLRNLAEEGIDRLLQRPRVQALWEQANRRAHRRFLQVVEGGGDAVSTEGGKVTLDLGAVLQRTSQGIGVGQRLAGRLPPGTAQITVMRSDQLQTAQDVVDVLKKLAVWLTVLSLGLFATAVAVAGRRREALRSVSIGFLVIGVGALVARSAAGNAVVNALATTEAVRPAAEDVWDVETSQLVIAAQAMIGYGVVLLLAAWVAGPTAAAVAVRRWAAPYLHDARYAFGAAAIVLVGVIAWGPVPSTRNPITLLILAGLLALGVEALRRQTAREFPEATLEAATRRRQEWWRRTRESLGSGWGPLRRAPSQAPEPAAAAPPSPDARLEGLERLGRLREAGVLDESEFEAEKRRFLAAASSGQ